MASPASSTSRAPETGEALAASRGSGGARAAVETVAFTTRDDLLLDLGDALGGKSSVRPVDTLDGALETLSSGKRAQILAIDARDLPDIRAVVDRVNTQAPHAAVLVFAHGDAEKSVAAALKGAKVAAILPLPIDKRKVDTALETAVSEALAKRAGSGVERTASVTVESFQSHPAASGKESEGGRNKTVVYGAGAAGLAALVAAGLYFFMHGGQPARTTAVAAKTDKSAAAAPADDATLAPAPTIETSLVTGKLDDLLEKARLAMRERRFTEPVGDNALLYYRSAAAVDPSSGEAQDGLQRIASVLANRFDDAMTAVHYDEAALALANLKSAAPKDGRIAGMEVKLASVQVSKALADGNVDRAAALVRQAQQSGYVPADQIAKWRNDIGRRQEDAKVQRLAGLVTDRIRDGRLVEPADDSASAYLQQLRDAAPTSSTTQRLTRDLNSAYLRKAREAGLANRSTEVDRWIAEARAGGVNAADLAAFQRDLSTARQKAAAAESDRLLQLARERLRDGRLTDPANDSAASYAAQLQATDPNNPGLTAVGRDLAAKLLERARAEARDGHAAQVDADLATAKRWGADPKDILAVQQTPASAKSAPSSAARPAAGSSNMAALAASLKRTRYVAPEYPSKALAQSLSGVVTVEFVVTQSGDTRDVRVLDSNPPGVFDRAATIAIKRWRYQPAVVDGAPVEVPVRTAIRFELPK